MDRVKVNLPRFEIARQKTLLFARLLPGRRPYTLEGAGVVDSGSHLTSEMFVPQRHVIPIIRVQ